MAALAKQVHQDDRGLGWFEKYIYLWIIVAGASGLLLGKLLPGVSGFIESANWQGVSLPLVVAMFFVMLPPMARIQFKQLRARHSTGARSRSPWWRTGWSLRC